MSGYIAKKLGMTRVLTENGEFVPATVLDVSMNAVDQVKTEEKDGVNAIVVARKLSAASKNVRKKQYRVENVDAFKKGQDITLDLADEAKAVRITGVSKGKGFQGVVKRYNFGGGRATHGGKYRKAPGSIGTRKPTKVMKGRKLPGHMGSDTITLREVPVLDMDKDNALLVVKGPVPGSMNEFVYVTLL